MIELFTFGTPNGHKASIALEEMGLPYHVHKVDIGHGEQFAPEFLRISPNNKIPALVDGDIEIFESIAILIYLAEKTGKFLPKETKARLAALSWCFFQVSAVGPMMGQLGHFKMQAKEKIPYAIDRYQKEVDHLFKVIDKRLGETTYLAGNEYTIADIATWPWLEAYQSRYKIPLNKDTHPNLVRWFDEIAKRPAVQKGMQVPG